MTATMSERDKELSLVQHLGELRTRLMVAAFAVLITSVIAFLFSTSIIRVLLIPVDCQWFEVTTRSLFPPDISARLGLTDRKSTRLNSSHITISYAVFCLKKK